MKLPIVEISFLDHAMSDGTAKGLIPCKVVGYLLGQDKRAYYLASWVCDGNPDDENSECFTILKHRGLKMRRVRVGR